MVDTVSTKWIGNRIDPQDWVQLGLWRLEQSLIDFISQFYHKKQETDRWSIRNKYWSYHSWDFEDWKKV